MRDFLNPKDFYNALCSHGMDYFCGVPDSLLKDFCAYVTSVTPKSRHVITSNEGQAIALAAGYHMATGRAGVVYLQVSTNAFSFHLPVCPDMLANEMHALYDLSITEQCSKLRSFWFPW